MKVRQDDRFIFRSFEPNLSALAPTAPGGAAVRRCSAARALRAHFFIFV